MSSYRLSRRRFLAASGSTATATLAGCGGALRTDGPTVVSKSFERLGPSSITNRISVAFDPDAPAVHITGFVTYDSENCDRPVLRSVSYDSNDDTLSVTVGHRRKLLALGCRDDATGSAYRASVRFAGGLPETVAIVEQNADGETDRRTVEIRRGSSK